MIRLDFVWRDMCKATACVEVPSIPLAISAAASEHYATAQSFGHTIDASLRLSDESAMPRLGPVPHPAYGWLLCSHRVNAKVLIVTCAAFVKSITLTMKHPHCRGM